MIPVVPELRVEPAPGPHHVILRLAPGHWAVLNLIEGSLRFVNLKTNEERLISAPDLVTIHPGLPHRVALEGPLSCRIDFYREPPD